MPAQNTRTALLIAGPTASGKSALALRLARERNGVIINADSMQVYRELRILSARPSAEVEAQVPHRLYGHVSGADNYSVARWLDEASLEIAQAWEEGRLPVLCGGTGLYFKALEAGLAPVPPIAPAIREAWRQHSGDLHAELRKRDPALAERLRPSDRQRIIRALEVIEATGRSLLAWQREGQQASVLRGAGVERLYLECPRDELYARAERRFDQMMAEGALDEVRALPNLPRSAPVMKAIGVPELLAHLNEGKTLEEAVRNARTATRHYIKRQLTWWRPVLPAWTRVREC